MDDCHAQQVRQQAKTALEKVERMKAAEEEASEMVKTGMIERNLTKVAKTEAVVKTEVVL